MKLDFSDITILLAGDFMIDHYIMGTSIRMSPEAPVPVVISKEEYSIPGGAGNVAMNLHAIGVNVVCLGNVGDDIWGEKLISILSNKGINIDSIEIVKNHPTTLKQRIYSNGKQVARLDNEELIDWTPQLSHHNINNYDACILSDYNKGAANNIKFDTDILIVDPKKDDFSNYSNANIITPNLIELQKTTSIELKNDQSIVDACTELIAKYNFDYIVAKKGDQGMTIVGQKNFVKHIKAHHVQEPDVTGAGDTVIAILSAVYTKTRDIELAAKIANKAAAIVVGKSGTATVTIDEIDQLFLK
jgi:D-glycero-beta-D-manno-heptose-7-phosphate kinase